MLVVHICAGTVGCLSGFVAVSFRKGGRWHAMAGKAFAVAMMVLALSGVYLAVVKVQPGNIFGGTITAYLVATSWVTARRRKMKTDKFDWAALEVVGALAVTEVTCGIQAALSPTGMKWGYEPGVYFFLGSVATLATIGDIRMLVRGGITGTARLARHLWRMCFAFFVASGSIFLARAHIFPAFMRTTGMLYMLTFLPLVLMAFWLVRLRVKKNAVQLGRNAVATAPAAD